MSCSVSRQLHSPRLWPHWFVFFFFPLCHRTCSPHRAPFNVKWGTFPVVSLAAMDGDQPPSGALCSSRRSGCFAAEWTPTQPLMPAVPKDGTTGNHSAGYKAVPVLIAAQSTCEKLLRGPRNLRAELGLHPSAAAMLCPQKTSGERRWTRAAWRNDHQACYIQATIK